MEIDRFEQTKRGPPWILWSKRYFSVTRSWSQENISEDNVEEREQTCKESLFLSV